MHGWRGTDMAGAGDTQTSAKVINKAAYFKKIEYSPHSEGQASFHNSRARFKVAVCGRRYGKTSMVARDIEPEFLRPDKWFWIVGPTYGLAEKEFRLIYDDFVRKLGLGKEKDFKKHYNPRTGEMSLVFPWNTVLEVKSADHPENLVGEGLDGVVMSEAAKHRKETWERFVRPALADRRGFAYFVSTPEGMNFLHQLWQYGHDPSYPEYESWQFPSWDNPIIYPGGYDDPEIQLLKRTMTPDWFAQEIAAEFTAFVGKIFRDWQEKTHVTRVPFRPEWPNYAVFDWGYTNPLACVEFQVCPSDDSIHIWREHYKSFMVLEDHLAELKSREQPEGYHINLAFGDAADPGAIETVGRDFAPCLGDPEAKKDWRRGIELMNQFMKPLPETGKPRYYVDHSCTNTIREHNNYRSKDPVKGNNVPEMAKNVDDHTIDAIRYGLMHIFELGANHHLNEIYNQPEDLMPIAVGSERGFFTR